MLTRARVVVSLTCCCLLWEKSDPNPSLCVKQEASLWDQVCTHIHYGEKENQSPFLRRRGANIRRDVGDIALLMLIMCSRGVVSIAPSCLFSVVDKLWMLRRSYCTMVIELSWLLTIRSPSTSSAHFRRRHVADMGGTYLSSPVAKKSPLCDKGYSGATYLSWLGTTSCSVYKGAQKTQCFVVVVSAPDKNSATTPDPRRV